MTVPSYLSKFQAKPVTDPAVIHKLATDAWRYHGKALLDVDTLEPWLRQAVTNEANRLYGRRHGGE